MSVKASQIPHTRTGSLAPSLSLTRPCPVGPCGAFQVVEILILFMVGFLFRPRLISAFYYIEMDALEMQVRYSTKTYAIGTSTRPAPSFDGRQACIPTLSQLVSKPTAGFQAHATRSPDPSTLPPLPLAPSANRPATCARPRST